MNVDVPRRRPIQAVAALPALPWLSIHLLLYLGIAIAVPVLWQLTPAGGLVEVSGRALTEVSSVIVSRGGLIVSALAAGSLGLLRLLADARWYRFRLAAVLLVAVPFPLLAFGVAGAKATMPVAVTHLLVVLLIVQPRRSHGMADRAPAR
ncbi:hypothetical protein F8279_03370 [Micromonospora sp. AMSO1212t]|uniref:Uncharacterized protein n=1 Tax=Micromonospora tulbaghiae TaxID=479978 RepID=A0ABY0KUC4_9ACTN|nr:MULTISPECIES: hypothetical protein [Micromonospora]KAB1909600.1 hypothetical protein F8279_03370 [Micromonospora sp. AMSO1212t]MDX5459774.1 hypothetical protein [Micromonospora tulbaghiae]SCF12742.1 hypothetical protein GA0070562_0378 [Micromonospora tulbaghiae]